MFFKTERKGGILWCDLMLEPTDCVLVASPSLIISAPFRCDDITCVEVKAASLFISFHPSLSGSLNIIQSVLSLKESLK